MTIITGFKGLDDVHKVTQIRCQGWHSDITPRRYLRYLLRRTTVVTTLSMNILLSSLNLHVYKDLLTCELRLILPQSLNTCIYPSYKNAHKVLGNVNKGLVLKMIQVSLAL